MDDLLDDYDYKHVSYRPTENLDSHAVKNHIFAFEVYNCIQHYDKEKILKGIKITGTLYLTLKEINDMITPATLEK